MYIYFKLFIAVYFNVICYTLPEYEDNAETCWFYVTEKYIGRRIVHLLLLPKH